MDKYCCKLKCITRPSVEVDGRLQCGCVNYCKCNCKTYYENNYYKYNTYEKRLETFKKLSFLHHPFCNRHMIELAKAGFYYVNGRDRVKCFKSKNVTIYDWKENDIPDEIHKKFCDCG